MYFVTLSVGSSVIFSIYLYSHREFLHFGAKHDLSLCWSFSIWSPGRAWPLPPMPPMTQPKHRKLSQHPVLKSRLSLCIETAALHSWLLLAVDPHKSPLPPTLYSTEYTCLHIGCNKMADVSKALCCVLQCQQWSGLACPCAWRRSLLCREKPAVVNANINKWEPQHVRCRYD